jgi:hypothetical protein
MFDKIIFLSFLRVNSDKQKHTEFDVASSLLIMGCWNWY